MKAELLERLQALRAGGRPVAAVTQLTSGAQALVHDGGVEGDLELSAATRAAALRQLATDSSGMLDGGLFLRAWNPPLRLVLIGAVHVSQALVPIARSLGFGVTIVDPRTAFASTARFPEVALATDWPDEALSALAPDSRTAVVTLTHDPKLDDPALRVALASEAFFVGALGSRRTHAARLERLRGDGVAEAALARIHAPVGLALGGRRPAEIAVAIAAQIVQALYAPTAEAVGDGPVAASARRPAP